MYGCGTYYCADIEAFVCGDLGGTWSSRNWVSAGKLETAMTALEAYLRGYAQSNWDFPEMLNGFDACLAAVASSQLGLRKLVNDFRSALPPESIGDFFPPIPPEILERQHDGNPYLLPIPNSQGGVGGESWSLTLTQVDNDPVELAFLGGFPANWEGFLRRIYTGKFFVEKLRLVPPATGKDGEAIRTLRIGVAPNHEDFHKKQARAGRESRNPELKKQRELGARLLNLARGVCLPDLGFPWQVCEFAFITPDNWRDMHQRSDYLSPGNGALDVPASGVLSLLLSTEISPYSHDEQRDDDNPNEPLRFVNAE